MEHEQLKYDELAIPPYREEIFKPKKTKYCLLIPTFNEIKHFPSQIKHMQEWGVFDLVDVISCDAGSTDGSADPEMLRSNGFTALLTREGPGRYSTDLRMGYGWAIKQGYDGFITVDATDRDDMSGLGEFIKKLDDGYDYIQGSRFVKGGRAVRTPFIRLFAIRMISDPILSISARHVLSDTTNGYRAYSKRFLLGKDVVAFRDNFYLHELIYYLPVIACKKKYRVAFVPVGRIYQEDNDFSTHANNASNKAYIRGVLNVLLGKYDPK